VTKRAECSVSARRDSPTFASIGLGMALRRFSGTDDFTVG